MTTPSSILAWRIPRTEQPEGWSPWVRIVVKFHIVAAFSWELLMILQMQRGDPSPKAQSLFDGILPGQGFVRTPLGFACAKGRAWVQRPEGRGPGMGTENLRIPE